MVGAWKKTSDECLLLRRRCKIHLPLGIHGFPDNHRQKDVVLGLLSVLSCPYWMATPDG